jgi:predicted ester cyclase
MTNSESVHAADAEASANLQRFHDNEFEGFNARNWDLFRELHADDVRVVMPDGSVVEGIERHLQDMLDMLVYLPDARIDSHSIKVAQRDWTAVVGTLKGTFSAPMPLPDGSTVRPTGNTLSLSVATFSRWENGRIAEETLFLDSGQFMAQLGLDG